MSTPFRAALRPAHDPAHDQSRAQAPVQVLRRVGVAALVAGGLALTTHSASAGEAEQDVELMHVQEGDVIRPIEWQPPVEGYRITGQFGATGLWSSTHTGLDFAVDYGTPIHSITGGVVTEAVYDGSYGNKTVVTTEDGTEIWYCHQEALAVSDGEEVQPGEVIGEVGMTGNTTGPHVHVEIRPGGGDPVDPASYLEAHRVEL